MTHTYVSTLTIIGSDDGFIWANAGILLIGPWSKRHKDGNLSICYSVYLYGIISADIHPLIWHRLIWHKPQQFRFIPHRVIHKRPYFCQTHSMIWIEQIIDVGIGPLSVVVGYRYRIYLINSILAYPVLAHNELRRKFLTWSKILKLSRNSISIHTVLCCVQLGNWFTHIVQGFSEGNLRLDPEQIATKHSSPYLWAILCRFRKYKITTNPHIGSYSFLGKFKGRF